MTVETLGEILTRFFGTPEAVRKLEIRKRRQSVRRRQLELDFHDDHRNETETTTAGGLSRPRSGRLF